MKARDAVLEYRIQLGTQVRTLRREQKLTQSQLGLMVGLDRSYISRIERGRCSATFDNIVVLANGLGVSPSELLDGIGDPNVFGQPVPVTLSVPAKRKPRYHTTEI